MTNAEVLSVLEAEYLDIEDDACPDCGCAPCDCEPSDWDIEAKEWLREETRD